MKYLVVKNSYEYDDNWYYQENGYEISSRLFNSKGEAETEKNKKNCECIRDDHFKFSNYNQGYYNDSFINYLYSLGLRENNKIHESITDEQILKLLELSGLEFYKTIEVDE